MSFYTNRKNAIFDIDEMYKQGRDIEIIAFKIEKRYGFGRKLVEERIALTDQISEKQVKNG